MISENEGNRNIRKESDKTEVSESNQYFSNVDLIYNYTEWLIKSIDNSLNRININLIIVLFVCGFVLISDFNKLIYINGSQNQLTIKYAMQLLLTINVWLCTVGLILKSPGYTVDPELLMSDEWFFGDKTKIKCLIINTWIEMLKEHERVGMKKAKIMVFAIVLLSISLSFLMLNTLVSLVN